MKVGYPVPRIYFNCSSTNKKKMLIISVEILNKFAGPNRLKFPGKLINQCCYQIFTRVNQSKFDSQFRKFTHPTLISTIFSINIFCTYLKQSSIPIQTFQSSEILYQKYILWFILFNLFYFQLKLIKNIFFQTTINTI